MVRGDGREEPGAVAKRSQNQWSQNGRIIWKSSWGRERTAQLLGWRVQRAEYASQEDPVIGGD